jgi:hypothetical protein
MAMTFMNQSDESISLTMTGDRLFDVFTGSILANQAVADMHNWLIVMGEAFTKTIHFANSKIGDPDTGIEKVPPVPAAFAFALMLKLMLEDDELVFNIV